MYLDGSSSTQRNSMRRSFLNYDLTTIAHGCILFFPCTGGLSRLSRQLFWGRFPRLTRDSSAGDGRACVVTNEFLALEVWVTFVWPPLHATFCHFSPLHAYRRFFL